jgi:hypothetical protein
MGVGNAWINGIALYVAIFRNIILTLRDSICECVTPQDKLGFYAVPLQSHDSDNGFLQQ